MIDLRSKFKKTKGKATKFTAVCPAHNDKLNSLSCEHKDGKWLVKCFAGCEVNKIVSAIGIEVAELFDEKAKGAANPSSNRATAQPCGLTIEKYAHTKGFSVEELKVLGLRDGKWDAQPAVRIPYYSASGEETAVRFRIAMEGDRFRWAKGAKLGLYGLNKLHEARTRGKFIILVEGESDCHTLWRHQLPAIGIPGANNWRDDRDAVHFDGIDDIFVVIEPDKGGEAVRKWLSTSTIRHRVKTLSLPTKDMSALHLVTPDTVEFKKRIHIAMLGAIPWTVSEAKAEAQERADAWAKCRDLAQDPKLLDAIDIALAPLVGERNSARIVYLALTSRLLDRPISMALKGPSSGGKSFVVESVLKLFPPEAFYALTAMSDRALAYGTEPLKHRHIIIYEAAGMEGDFATYLMRSLLSEGCIRYETVEKTRDGLVPKLIEREGPTGLIVTTTKISLHPENETRLLSLTITDTQDQTRAVLHALAEETRSAPDRSDWHALQTWLATGSTDVHVPFATELAGLVPPVAVRLRRDFKMVLQLIRAHALLHQTMRQRDAKGRIIADIKDYAAVRILIGDLVSAGVDATVKKEVRETVECVGKLICGDKQFVQSSDLRAALKLDKSSVSRRVEAALAGGFLKNLEDKKGKPHKLVLGDPLPSDLAILPEPEQLRGCAVAQGDKDAGFSTASSPPPWQTNGRGIPDIGEWGDAS